MSLRCKGCLELVSYVGYREYLVAQNLTPFIHCEYTSVRKHNFTSPFWTTVLISWATLDHDGGYCLYGPHSEREHLYFATL